MRTPLYNVHKALNAKMVDFAGWDMPIQYGGLGLLTEHGAVRTNAGLFDVSHMGQLEFVGPDASATVNRLITNDLSAIGDGKAQYTCICNDDGYILDDAISYKFSNEHVMMVVNASNVGKIDAWVKERATGDTEYRNVSDKWALLALQGPRAHAICAAVIPESEGMAPFAVRKAGDLILATTGYTGESGFEIFIPVERAESIWSALMSKGAAHGLVPVGLGARDTLRLEMKYSLYGNDIDETTHPLEAGLGWVTKLDKSDGFIGCDALRTLKAAGLKRRLVAIQLTERGIARHGYSVHAADGKEVIGEVTSGTKSPSTGNAIAMAYVALPFNKIGTNLTVDIRGRKVAASVVKPPFYRSEEN